MVTGQVRQGWCTVPCVYCAELLGTRIRQDCAETRGDNKDYSYFDPVCVVKLAERCQLLVLYVVDEQG